MTVEIGSIINVIGREWIVLDATEIFALCLSKDFVWTCQFDSNTNNFAKSKVCKDLNGKFLKNVDTSNLFDMTIDLTSDDGLDDYGQTTQKVGLLTADMYRKYNRIIEKYPVNNWWWLATPFSTPHRGYSASVRCVRDGGTLSNDCCFNSCGVRPFINLYLPSLNL